jgi:tetratricopeptide (TPR) repeat protein
MQKRVEQRAARPVSDVTHENTEAQLLEQAQVLIECGNRLREAEHLDDALRIFRLAHEIAGRLVTVNPDNVESLQPYGASQRAIGYVLFEKGEYEAACTAFDEVIDGFRTATEPALRGLVARALLNKGIALGYTKDACIVYDEIVRSFGTAVDPVMRELVAKALFNKVGTFAQLGDSDQAKAAFDEFIDRFGKTTEPTLRALVAQAFVNMGIMISNDEGQGHEETAFYLFEAVCHYEGQEPTTFHACAEALLNKGKLLFEMGSSNQACAAFDELVSRFGSMPELALREMVAEALFNKGVVLRESAEVRGTWGKIVARFNKRPARSRTKNACAAWEEVIQRFGSASEPTLRELVGKALVNKAAAAPDPQAACVAYDEVLQRFGSASEPALRELVSMALRSKGIALTMRGDFEGACRIFDETVDLFGTAAEAPLRAQAAAALVAKGLLLRTMGQECGVPDDTKKAQVVFHEVVRRFGKATEPEILEWIAKARGFLDESGPTSDLKISDEGSEISKDIAPLANSAGDSSISEGELFDKSNVLSLDEERERRHRRQSPATMRKQLENVSPVADIINFPYNKVIVKNATEAIEFLASLLPNEQDRSHFQAKIIAEFEAAGGITSWVKTPEKAEAHLDATEVSAAAKVLVSARGQKLSGRPRLGLDPRLPNKAPEIYRNRARRPELGGKKENIVQFVQRVYEPWLDILTRADLRILDESADKAIENWISAGRDLPQGLLLKERELTVAERAAKVRQGAKVSKGAAF